MRPEVRRRMRELEQTSTAALAHAAERANPFGPDYRTYSRTALLNHNLRLDHAPLEADEGWDPKPEPARAACRDCGARSAPEADGTCPVCGTARS
jgi:rubrerythrin